jgi:hypothetical protein
MCVVRVPLPPTLGLCVCSCCFPRDSALTVVVVLAQASAVELAAVPHEQLRELALQCCVPSKELRDAVLHSATVAVNRANAGRRRRANPQQLTAEMSAADIAQQCTASYLRAWLSENNAGFRVSGMRKAQLVEAVVRCLRGMMAI